MTRRECPSCSRDISALHGDTCDRLRCKRNVENERRRGILGAVLTTLREATKSDDAGPNVQKFAGELTETIEKAGVR